MRSDTTYDLRLSSFRTTFNIRLGDFLEKKNALNKRFTDLRFILKTFDHATSIINDGGKRIRPYLCFLAYVTEGGQDYEEALRISVGLELLHYFALIHDDIIDKGLERHGKPTIHKYVESAIAQNYRGDPAHIGEAMALLVGDIVFSWSHEIMASARNPQVSTLFFSMIEEVVVGQMLDVSFMTQRQVSVNEILHKNELKTARYSFVNPMLIGAAIAQSEKHTGLYEELGLKLGQAFQMQDDILDIVGDSATGKKPFVDINVGQHTTLTQYIFDHGTQKDKDILQSRFGVPHPTDDTKTLLAVFTSSGAIQHAEKEIDRLLKQAKKIIDRSDIKEKKIWNALVSYLDKRKS